MSELVTYESWLADSSRWERFSFRPGDIVISSPNKSGTTWTQLLVALILFEGSDFPAPVSVMSPWLDMKLRSEEVVFQLLGDQTHRRFIKTHTPLDGVPIHDHVTYLCPARDPRDAAISMTHHVNNLDWEKAMEAAAAYGSDLTPPERDGDTFPPDAFLRGWVAPDAEPEGWSLHHVTHHYSTVFDRLHRPNVERFHFLDYQRDLAGSIERLGRHLGVAVDDPELLAQHATIDAARNRAAATAPDGHLGIWQEPEKFFRNGGSGEWRQYLSEDDLEVYHRRVVDRLGEEHAQWLHHGGS